MRFYIKHFTFYSSVCVTLNHVSKFVCFCGRFPWLLPMLEPDYVADKIQDAVLCNQTMLCVPRIIYLFYMLKGYTIFVFLSIIQYHYLFYSSVKFCH